MDSKDLNEKFMRAALVEARDSRKNGEWVGGAVLVRNNKIIAKAGNTVRSSNNPTAHSEISVIREACKKLKTTELHNVDLYTNAEPCPMCMTACVWAGIRTIYFGASLEDLMKLGDHQIKISSEEIASRSFREIKVVGGVCRKESIDMFDL